MGVKELWPIIEPIKIHKRFEEMTGEKVAVDLSMWIVDSQNVKLMTGTVTKPHLRNLFFRTATLLQSGIHPVFVIEGTAPELKWQTMSDRISTKHKSIHRVTGKSGVRRRTHFQTILRECCEMIEYLGLPYIQACGEAEALCAALNMAGLVDAVITDDGDAFLYGARTVYRGFTTTKDPSVESYSMDDIESTCKLQRSHLIALALLVGCDYCPKGVPGVGVSLATKLCAETRASEALDKLKHWATKGLIGNESSTEKSVAQKIIKMDDRNFLQVIAEFLNPIKVPSNIQPWKKPLILRAQEFNFNKLEWPRNYTLEKVLPLLTLWCLTAVKQGQHLASDLSIKPEKILKKRIRHGKPMLEVLWNLYDPYEIEEENNGKPDLITLEPEDLFTKCYPNLVEDFLVQQSEKQVTKTKKDKTKKKIKNDIKVMEEVTDIISHTISLNQKMEDLAIIPAIKNTKRLLLCTDFLSKHDGLKQEVSNESEDLPFLNDSHPRGRDVVTDPKSECQVGAGALDRMVPLSSPLRSHIRNDSSYSYNYEENALKMGKILDSQNTDPLVVSRPRKKTGDESLDNLLADISNYLQSPAKTAQSSLLVYDQPERDISPLRRHDNIVSGHFTPVKPVTTVSFGCKQKQNEFLLEANNGLYSETTIPLFDINSDFQDSDISLFDDINYKTPSGKFKRTSFIKSTPLNLNISGLANVKESISYGDFDIIPHLSSFTPF